MAAGYLVDDDLVESVVRRRLDDHDWNFGFVVDGFPRNARQAEFFLESYDIDGVIDLHRRAIGAEPDPQRITRLLAPERFRQQQAVAVRLIAQIKEFLEPVTPADATRRHNQLSPLSSTTIVCSMGFANKAGAVSSRGSPQAARISKSIRSDA